MPHSADVPLLTDGVVTLRRPTGADVPSIVAHWQNAQAFPRAGGPDLFDPRAAAEWVSRSDPRGLAEGTSSCFAVEHAGRFAGLVSLTSLREGEAELEVGLGLEARGQGVASRAVRLLLEWGFSQRGYAVVHWHAAAGDFAARRVAWATGFTFGPTVPRVYGGELIDTWTGWTTPGAGRQPRAPWPEPPVLETARLRLRPWRAEDGQALVEASADPRLRHFIPHSPLPRDLGAVPAYLDRVGLAEANGDRLAWCVADRECDAALGNVAVFEFDGSPGELTAQVGYWAHPEARGRGVMAEAVSRVADWCLEPEPEGLGARRLYLLTAASNLASRRVAEASGFEQVGTERLGGPVGDGYEDSALYDRLREA